MRNENFRKRRANLWSVEIAALDNPIEIAEKFQYDILNEIRLFEYQGQWGYCLRVWAGDTAGVFYGPFLSFCDPYSDRMAALTGAVDELLECCVGSTRKSTGSMVAWAKSLVLPGQLRMDI